MEIDYPTFSIANLIDRMFNKRFDIPATTEKRIKIFVAQHFAVKLPDCFVNRNIYVPIHVGCANADSRLPETIGDDSEPSISRLNAYLNEMTAIYWVAKHYFEEIDNPDYVGFVHYRRSLDWKPELLKPGTIIASRFATIISNKKFFVNCHGEKWLNLFMARFYRKFGAEFMDIDRFWHSHTLFVGNNFITDRITFIRYFDFAEKCIGICCELLDENIEEFSSMSTNKRRQFSFIMERMTSYWIWHEHRIKKIKLVSARLRCYDISNNQTAVR